MVKIETETETEIGCEMVIDWRLGPDGDPADEVLCTRPATRAYSGGQICEICAADLVASGVCDPAEIASIGDDEEGA